MIGKEKENPEVIQEIKLDDLKDDDKVIWYDSALEIELEVDGGKIKRLNDVIRREEHKGRVRLVLKEGKIFALVSYSN